MRDAAEDYDEMQEEINGYDQSLFQLKTCEKSLYGKDQPQVRFL